MNSQLFDPQQAQIPETMQDRYQFCIWKKEERNGKPTKVPYNPKQPDHRAQTNHPETFGSYAEAVRALQTPGASGIGVRIDSGLWAIDIDHCVDEHGQLTEMAREIIRIMDSPTEYSPSGSGVHIYFTADQADFSKERYYINNQKLGLEVYPSGKTYKFLTVTGKRLPGTPTEMATDRSSEISEVLERYMLRDQPTGTSDGGGRSILEDDEIYAKASASKNGDKFKKLWNGDTSEYPSHSEADAALCSMLAFWCNKDAGQMDRLFRQSGLMRSKWDTDRNGITYGADLIRKCIANCRETYHSPEDVPAFIRFNAKGLPYVHCPELAEYIRNDLKYLRVRDDGKRAMQIYVYENGVYQLYAPDMFKGIIRDYIAAYDRNLVNTRDIRETYDQLVMDRNCIRQEALNADEGVINFRNGLLKVSADSLELMPHNPDVLSTIQIPCEWTGQDSPTPVFDSFLRTLTDGSEETIRFLLQWLGVVLSNIHGWRCKKALIMHGPGDTGKSVLKSLAERLLGKGNYIGTDLAEIEARFGTGAIFGTRLAGSSDMSYVTVSELKTFKKLTGGDSLFAEFKGQQCFEFVYSGLLWFCTNRPPKFGGDDGQWVYDRIMLLECKNVIPKEQQDKTLLDKLYAESEGIAYKAIKALQQVIANGYRFDEPETMKKAREEYMHTNNSVISFFDECMEPRPNNQIVDLCTMGRLYDVYRAWCSDNNNGYAKTYREFRDQLAEYLGSSFKNLSVKRNNGTYLRSYTLNNETKSQYNKVYGCNDTVQPLIGA